MDDFYVFILAVLVVHGVLLFLDVIFKSCSHYPYLYFLSNTGLQISPLRVHWFTSCLNRQIQKWGTRRPRLLAAWFSAGTYVSVGVLPLAILLICQTTFTAIKNSTASPMERQTLLVEPMVPGWNLPSADLSFYLVSIIISSIVHEVGHAMAAVREDIHLVGFGVSIFFCIPLVVTHMDKLDALPPFRQLRILCAGVWHNMLLSLVAAIIATTLPWLMFPFFDFGSGVQVEDLKLESAVNGHGGLVVGDQVFKINECHVRGITSWQECLVTASLEPTPGFCIPENFIKEYDESIPAKHISESTVDCCSSNSPSHLCFEYVGTEDEPLPIPQHTCLQARNVVDISRKTCIHSSDCLPSLHCFRPSLNNSTKLIRIQRTMGKTVLFLGTPSEIYHSVTATDFIRLYKYLPSFIPDAITKLCHFITIFSSGLAVLNIIPCFFFDGQHIIGAVIEVLFSRRIGLSSVRHAIALCITIIGTLLLAVYIIVMFMTM